jgi:sugar fermentation stimulation protein A
VDSFEPAADIDPKYAAGLAEARERGVEVVAWTSRVLPGALELERSIPVRS